MKKTLLIMAAGLGSRYGDLKQMDPVGPQNEVLLDYSLYDAYKAGFTRIVFVIRHSFAESFREQVGTRVSRVFDVAYAYQEKQVAVRGGVISSQRVKPWGTGHAVLVARELIEEPFVVINADDFYGRSAFESAQVLWESGNEDLLLGGYQLGRTLSDHGHVSRGICRCDEKNYLKGIDEYTEIVQQAAGIVGCDPQGTLHTLAPDAVTSMNFWGLTPDIFGCLDSQFQEFIRVSGNTSKQEFYLPTAIDTLIHSGEKKVKVQPVMEDWFGVTYPQDKPKVQTEIEKKIDQGLYPCDLWKDLQS